MVFDAYAKYYDALYRNKDYAAEAAYVASHIRSHLPNATRILELGCGTGAHAQHLAAMGYTVHGVDLSEIMLARANARRATLQPDVAARMSFGHGDVRSVRMNRNYDAVISLFNVMGYQTANADLKAAFETAAIHLQPGGLFMFDFWYGPAVLTQRPEVRVKRFDDQEIKVTRISEPVMKFGENVVDVNFTMFIEQKATQVVQQVRETHSVRYLFLPELMQYRESLFRVHANHDWMSGDSLSAQSWDGFQVLSRE